MTEHVAFLMKDLVLLAASFYHSQVSKFCSLGTYRNDFGSGRQTDVMLFPPVTVLPLKARRQACLSTEVNNV
jgi:hypothetical protein